MLGGAWHSGTHHSSAILEMQQSLSCYSSFCNRMRGARQVDEEAKDNNVVEPQNTRYHSRAWSSPRLPNHGLVHTPTSVQAAPWLAAYKKLSTGASVTTVARIKPRMMKPSQGPCKKLESCPVRITARRKAKRKSASTTRRIRAS